MSIVLRAAIVARLNDAASIFDSLIAKTSSCEPASKAEIYEQSHAASLAGVTIWEAVESGVFNVPSVARLVGKLRAGGCGPRPKAGDDSEQLFIDTAAEFCYRGYESLFPNYEHIEEGRGPTRKAKRIPTHFVSNCGSTNSGNTLRAAECSQTSSKAAMMQLGLP